MLILGIGIFVLLSINLYFEVKNQRALKKLYNELIRGTLKLNQSVSCMIKTLTIIAAGNVDEISAEITAEIDKLKRDS
jgi:hypothetical protein